MREQRVRELEEGNKMKKLEAQIVKIAENGEQDMVDNTLI